MLVLHMKVDKVSKEEDDKVAKGTLVNVVSQDNLDRVGGSKSRSCSCPFCILQDLHIACAHVATHVLARVETHVLARVETHVLAHVEIHVLARVETHVLVQTVDCYVLARVVKHVLAHVETHVLARVLLHVLDYYSKTCSPDTPPPMCGRQYR